MIVRLSIWPAVCSFSRSFIHSFGCFCVWHQSALCKAVQYFSFWDFFEPAALIVFESFRWFRKGPLNALQQWSLKGPIGGKCSGSTAAAVWRHVTAEEAGLMAADVLAVLWLEERWLVVVGPVVKTAAVC